MALLRHQKIELNIEEREKSIYHAGQASQKLLTKKTQFIIFYAHVHACISYADEQWRSQKYSMGRGRGAIRILLSGGLKIKKNL